MFTSLQKPCEKDIKETYRLAQPGAPSQGFVYFSL